VLNDVTMRDLQREDRQWLRAKGSDGFAPMGPVVVTADELGDPAALRLRSSVNGETWQDSTTAEMVFDVPTIVAFASRTITLEPGDIIATGTPAGVGHYQSIRRATWSAGTSCAARSRASAPSRTPVVDEEPRDRRPRAAAGAGEPTGSRRSERRRCAPSPSPARPGSRAGRAVPVPEPGPGEVLLRMEAASICGTDYHLFRWDEWAAENLVPPRILGHELAGTVIGTGAGVTRVREGDLVGVESHIVDWTCAQCRRGQMHLCRNLKVIGVHVDGGFAKYAVIPQENAIESNGLDPAVVALQEPMGNAVHAAFAEPIEGRACSSPAAGRSACARSGSRRRPGRRW
jgi:hypothetical protein